MSETIMEEPPAEIKGKVTPVKGMVFVTPPILIKACKANITMIPTPVSIPNISGLRTATRMPRHMKIRKIRMNKALPMNPSSSPMIAR